VSRVDGSSSSGLPGVAQAALDDTALADVLNWILERFGRDDLPQGFVPYAAAEVGRLRHQPLTNVQRRQTGADRRAGAGEVARVACRRPGRRGCA